MIKVIRGYWAEVFENESFICVETWSGYRGGDYRDFKGKQNLLATTVDNSMLGLAVIDALTHSRWVLGSPREGNVYPSDIEFDASLCNYKENYSIWVDSLMKRYGYKTKRDLLKNMKNVSVEKRGEMLTFSPMDHTGLDLWEVPDKGEKIEISVASTPEEIGGTLRLALGRCSG